MRSRTPFCLSLLLAGTSLLMMLGGPSAWAQPTSPQPTFSEPRPQSDTPPKRGGIRGSCQDGWKQELRNNQRILVSCPGGPWSVAAHVLPTGRGGLAELSAKTVAKPQRVKLEVDEAFAQRSPETIQASVNAEQRAGAAHRERMTDALYAVHSPRARPVTIPPAARPRSASR